MKVRIRRFRMFSYRACDRFAEYLHEMSLKGWHFQERRLGLVFVRGEARDYEYDVEVFPKGSEMDLRPTEDTEEYAEYCKAAGWEFLDAYGKICIFRKLREDALPIVEPQERLQNIIKAERSRWINNSLGAILLAGIYILEFWYLTFTRWAFSSLMSRMITGMLLLAICAACEGIALEIWCKKQKQRMEKGENPRYESTAPLSLISKILFWGMICMTLAGSWSEQPYLNGWLLAGLICIAAVALITAAWRPHAAENQMFQIGVLCGFTLLAVTLIMVTGSGEEAGRPAEELKEIPVTQAAYREKNDLDQERAEMTKSWFGTACFGTLRYAAEEGGAECVFHYEIYRSSYQWVVERTWKETYRERENLVDCADIWGADEAFRFGKDGTYWYYVRYADRVVSIYLETDHEPEEIEVADWREWMGLGKTQGREALWQESSSRH